MQSKPVVGLPVNRPVLLVGQAPGIKEPKLSRPFAWTAGKTLFRWFFEICGLPESVLRERIYFAAVCRCFPGKAPSGGDRVPTPEEIRACAPWLQREMELLRPQLVIPVGRLAIAQFLPQQKLDQIIGRSFPFSNSAGSFDLIPLPHPSGASTWHRTEPGISLLRQALQHIVHHPAFQLYVMESSS